GGPQTVRGGIVIGGDENTTSSGNTVENNVIAYTATAGIDTYWQGRVGTHNTESRNCFWQAHREADGARVTADPRFRAPARVASPASVQRFVDALRPGQTGCLRGGTYDRMHNGYIARFGEPGVSLRSAPGQRAHLVGIVMVAPEADRVRLSHLSIEGTGDHNT